MPMHPVRERVIHGALYQRYCEHYYETAITHPANPAADGGRDAKFRIVTEIVVGVGCNPMTGRQAAPEAADRDQPRRLRRSDRIRIDALGKAMGSENRPSIASQWLCAAAWPYVSHVDQVFARRGSEGSAKSGSNSIACSTRLG
jgi:hypothetical protein